MKDNNFLITLKGLRTTYGLKQVDVSKLLNINVSTWASYENGITYPKATMIKRIEKLFNISYDHISFKPELRLNRK